jgi:hypothetical protein
MYNRTVLWSSRPRSRPSSSLAPMRQVPSESFEAWISTRAVGHVPIGLSSRWYQEAGGPGGGGGADGGQGRGGVARGEPISFCSICYTTPAPSTEVFRAQAKEKQDEEVLEAVEHSRDKPYRDFSKQAALQVRAHPVQWHTHLQSPRAGPSILSRTMQPLVASPLPCLL